MGRTIVTVLLTIVATFSVSCTPDTRSRHLSPHYAIEVNNVTDVRLSEDGFHFTILATTYGRFNEPDDGFRFRLNLVIDGKRRAFPGSAASGSGLFSKKWARLSGMPGDQVQEWTATVRHESYGKRLTEWLSGGRLKGTIIVSIQDQSRNVSAADFEIP